MLLLLLFASTRDNAERVGDSERLAASRVVVVVVVDNGEIVVVVAVSAIAGVVIAVFVVAVVVNAGDTARTGDIDRRCCATGGDSFMYKSKLKNRRGMRTIGSKTADARTHQATQNGCFVPTSAEELEEADADALNVTSLRCNNSNVTHRHTRLSETQMSSNGPLVDRIECKHASTACWASAQMSSLAVLM